MSTAFQMKGTEAERSLARMAAALGTTEEKVIGVGLALLDIVIQEKFRNRDAIIHVVNSEGEILKKIVIPDYIP